MSGKIGVVTSDRMRTNTKQSKGTVSEFNQGSVVSKESDNPIEMNKTCFVVIIDSRQCLREALADAFEQKLRIKVSIYESLKALTQSGSAPEEMSSLILQLPVGSSRPELEEEVATLREWAPEVKIILLVDKLTREIAEVCKALDIKGLVSSEYSSGQILVCVSVVESGLSYFPAEIEPVIGRKTYLSDGEIDNVQLPNLDGMLTPRQQQVMRYIAIGKSNKYIAAELSLCESTVKVHVSEVMRRLGATSRTHASYIINQLENKSKALG